jgi:ClpP class serine protease
VNTVTAGKYKRTLTATKKTTKDDIDKAKEDAESILELFKGYVKANRPTLDLEDLATGEVWFGTDAVEKGLCDEIITKDDLVLRDYIDKGFDCFSIKYEEPKDERGGLRDFLPVGAQSLGKSQSNGFLRRLVRDVVRAAKDEIVGSDLVNQGQRMEETSHSDYRLQ